MLVAGVAKVGSPCYTDYMITFKSGGPNFEYKYPTSPSLQVFDGEPARAAWGWDGNRIGWVQHCPVDGKWIAYAANASVVGARRDRESAAQLLLPDSVPDTKTLLGRRVRRRRRLLRS